MKVLLVCLGNICRSPTAEAVFRARANAAGLNNAFDSAGTGGWHIGRPPDPRAIRAGAKRGFDLSPLRGRQISASDFHDFDLILTMDEDNFETVQVRAPNAETAMNVKPVLSVLPDGDGGVPDPYYGGDDGFEHVLDLLERAADAWSAQWSQAEGVPRA